MIHIKIKLIVLTFILMNLLASPWYIQISMIPKENIPSNKLMLRPNNSDINILTPENKSYSKNTGCYLSSYDFDDLPVFSDFYGVIDELDGHNHSLKIAYGNLVTIGDQFSRLNGSIEFYFRTEDATDRTVLSFKGTDTIPHIYLYILNDEWYYLNRDTLKANVINLTDSYKPLDNTWHLIKVDFEATMSGYTGLSLETWRLTVDGHPSTLLKMFRSSISPPPCVINKILIFSDVNEPNGASYFDAFGYSWDKFYDVGDNLNEGLPLLFETSVSLDWMAYSLDGLPNIEIPGNTTILMPNNGSHSIKIIANDSIGTIYESVTRYFVVSPILFLDPNRNSIWEEGLFYEIKWTTALNISNVDIEIYKDNILKYSHYGLKNNGTFDWLVPDGVDIGKDWKIKITDSSDSLIFGVSEFFEIVKGIYILTPDSSSLWYICRRYFITWSTSGNISYVNIEFFRDTILEYSKTHIPNNSSYSYYVYWYVPPSTNWTIKISDYNNASIFYISEPFEISDNKSISILSPLSTVSWERGTEQYIKWIATGNISHVDIELFIESTRMYLINNTENDGAKLWKIDLEEQASKNWRIKITASDNLTIFAWSDYFEVYERPELLIASPRRPARFLADTDQWITWTRSVGCNVSFVTLEAYKGPDFMYNLGNIDSQIEEFFWDIPFDPPPGLDWRIKISDTYDSSIYSFSDTFEIYSYKSIKITVPTTSDNWSIPGDHYISWSWTEDVPNVNIEIYKGTMLIDTILNLPNNGSTYWHMPYNEPTGTDWKVKVMASNYHGINDEVSNIKAHIKRAFEVLAPHKNQAIFRNDYFDIVWKSNGSISNVKIDLYEEGTFVKTITNMTLNDGRYLWHIISNVKLSKNYQIKISDVAYPSVYAFSEQYFQLEGARIPGYNLLIIIGIISISIILLKNRLKIRIENHG